MRSPLEALMQEYGTPMTRDNYIQWNNLGKKSAKVSPEEESELPKRFQYPIVSPTEAKPSRASVAAAKKAEGGAPADFPGPVLPNPKGLKPALDTDKPVQQGPRFATMQAHPYYKGDSVMDTSNPEQSGIVGDNSTPEPEIPMRPTHKVTVREQ